MDEWALRIMVYGAGDAINGAGLDQQIQAQVDRLASVVTNRYVAGVVQLDSSTQPSLRYVLDPYGRQPVTQIPNFDTGDPAQLVDFVEYAAICPARRAVLVLSGHGCAWQDNVADQAVGARVVIPAIIHPRRLFGHGISAAGAAARAVLVDGTNHDYLSNAELGAALERVAGLLGGALDVVVFDACLMSSWELLGEIEDSVAVVVASLDELSVAGIDMAGPAAVLTAQQGAATAQQVGQTVAAEFSPQASFDTCIAIDLSSPAWKSAAVSFAAFSIQLLSWVQASSENADAARTALRLAATSVVQYASRGLSDIGALASAFRTATSVPSSCLSALDAAVASVKSCVLAARFGGDYTGAVGLSVFAPGSLATYAANRPDYTRLRFATSSGWSTVLDALYPINAGTARAVAPVATGADQTTFAVELRGLKLDEATKQRIEAAVRATVTQRLADRGLPGKLAIQPLDRVATTRAILGNPVGFVAELTPPEA